jgi:hypothetical protein
MGASRGEKPASGADALGSREAEGGKFCRMRLNPPKIFSILAYTIG